MTVKQLQEYKSALTSSLSQNLDSFEKNFLLIAGGILAFSVTFIKEIVKIENAIDLRWLFIGWGAIILSVTLMMITFVYSAWASNQIWKIVNDFYLQQQKFDDVETYAPADLTPVKKSADNLLFTSKNYLFGFRVAAIITFLIGITSFSYFVGVNIDQENADAKSTKITNQKKSTITIKKGDSVITTVVDTVITAKKK